ncbi:MAG: TspO/MBR family-domain-containing protein [Benniella sp.]|nr:MAG: TspO/MBR family-domain-containing protein [Benniella sp.]
MDSYFQASQSLVNTNLARYPVLAVGLPLAGGFLSTVPGRHVKGYYESLRKPDWAPPASVFAPAWTALYISIGYASHLVALRSGPNTVPSIRSLAHTGLGVYGFNMLLNFAWSPLMFWRKNIGAALVTAGGLATSSVAVAYYFFKVDKVAGYLTLPYVAWLGYATALNYDVWIKNSHGTAADHARRIGKDVNDAARHARGELKDAAEHAKHEAKDAARHANKNARKAANEAADKLDQELH